MKKLKNVKDGECFKLSNRKSAASYTMIKKVKGQCTFTSNNSDKSYTRPGDTQVIICK